MRDPIIPSSANTDLFRWLRALVEMPLALVYPEVCQICLSATAAAAEGYLCEACRRQLRPVKPPFCRMCGLPVDGEVDETFQCPNCRDTRFYFESARSAVRVNGMMLDLLHRFKYQAAHWLEPFFERLLYEALSKDPHLASWDGVVPVPLHPLRAWERGFNQSAALARPIARRLGIRYEADCMKRIAPTPSQTMLSRGERLENVMGAFAMKQGRHLKGRRLLVVDDVLTTGATTNACAKVCREAGALSVHVWTLARGVGTIP